MTKLKDVNYIAFQGLTERDLCKSLMLATKPDVVIYAVGSNDIDSAERDSRTAQYQHTAGATYLQAASEGVKAKFVYLSSDTIFSGHAGNYAEEDITIPSSALGKAKMGAENHIRGRSLNYIIVRSAPLLGRGPLDHPSWVDRLRESALIKKKFKVSERLIRNPIHIGLLSEVISYSIEYDLKNKILHLGGLTKVSEHELALRISKANDIATENLEVLTTGRPDSIYDFSLNFSQTLTVCKYPILTLQQSMERL